MSFLMFPVVFQPGEFPQLWHREELQVKVEVLSGGDKAYIVQTVTSHSRNPE